LYGNNQPDGLETEGHGLDPTFGKAMSNDVFGAAARTANKIVLELAFMMMLAAIKSCGA
jgi:hypothetical protein